MSAVCQGWVSLLQPIVSLSPTSIKYIKTCPSVSSFFQFLDYASSCQFPKSALAARMKKLINLLSTLSADKTVVKTKSFCFPALFNFFFFLVTKSLGLPKKRLFLIFKVFLSFWFVRVEKALHNYQV